MAFQIFEELTWVALNGVSTSYLSVSAYPTLGTGGGQAAVSLQFPLTTSTDGTDPESNITQMAQFAIGTSPISSITRVELNDTITTPIHRLVVVGWQPANSPGGTAPGIAAAAFDSAGNLLGGGAHSIFDVPSTQGKREDDPPVFLKLLYGNVAGNASSQATLTPAGSGAQAVPVSEANTAPESWNPGMSVSSFAMGANNAAGTVSDLANPLDSDENPLLTDYVMVTNNQRIACFGWSNNATNQWGFLKAISGGMDPQF